MRQVAGKGEHLVVMLRRHGFDYSAQRPPEAANSRDRHGRIADWCDDDHPTVKEIAARVLRSGLLAAGDGMTTDEVNPRRHSAGEPADDGGFRAAHVGQECSRPARIAAVGNGIDDAIHGSANDDERRLADGAAQVGGRLVDHTQAARAGEDFLAAVAADDGIDESAFAGGQGD